MKAATTIIGVCLGALIASGTTTAQEGEGRVLLAQSQLNDKSAVIRWQGANELRRIGKAARSAAPVLCQHMLADDDARVRAACAAALIEIVPDTPDAVEHLRKATKDPNNIVRTHAVTALGKMGPKAKAAVPTLIEALTDDDDQTVRISASLALVDVGEAAIPALTECLMHDEEFVRASASRALGDIGPAAKSAGQALVDLLVDEKQPSEVRSSSFVALVKIQPGRDVTQRAIPTLISVLQKGRRGARLQAAWALGQLGSLSKEAIPALQEAAKDEDETLRELAETSLKQIESAKE